MHLHRRVIRRLYVVKKRMGDSWLETQATVCTAMADYTHPFVVAIQRVISNDLGEPCGTGSYLRLRGHTYILTNDHVARHMTTGGLSHQPRADDFAHRFVHPFLSVGPPVDAAISRIDDESWNSATKKAIPASRVAQAHNTVEHELLFLQGYPGERTRWSAFANGPIARAVPYLTQEAPLPHGLDPRVYFALHYSPEHATPVKGSGPPLPIPRGFSGSLVWDTRFGALRGENWNPGHATVTGLVCMWGQGDVANLVLAVRIEVVRSMILTALRQEAAYFRWLARGRPEGDAFSDWLSAEREIVELG